MSKIISIVCFSDTHSLHEEIKLPAAHIALFTGDLMTSGKNKKELIRFLEWYDKQPVQHKVMIAGNHDFYFERHPGYAKHYVDKTDVIYLENSSVELEGLKIYGTPIQPEFCNWAFNKIFPVREDYFSKIPMDTNILMTHCPPEGKLDQVESVFSAGYRVGDDALRMRVDTVKPIIHCFGHIHGDFGIEEVQDTTYVNASCLDEQYRVRSETPYHILYVKDGEVIDVMEGER